VTGCAMLSGLQSDIRAFKNTDLPTRERKTHQYFVKYTPGYYWSPIPEHPQHEDCRNLAIYRISLEGRGIISKGVIAKLRAFFIKSPNSKPRTASVQLD
jgi:hypothetical protein